MAKAGTITVPVVVKIEGIEVTQEAIDYLSKLIRLELAMKERCDG